MQAALSLSGELPAGAAAAAVAASTAEEKPAFSLFDKIRGKRRASVDSPMLPKAAPHPTRLSLDGGTCHYCLIQSATVVLMQCLPWCLECSDLLGAYTSPVCADVMPG